MQKRKKWLSFILCMCMTLSLSLGMQLPTKAAENDKIRVTCVGDSITYGIGVQNGNDSYPSQLQAKLGDDYQVIRCGASGAFATESDDKQRVWNPYNLTDEYRDSLASNPDIVVILLGTNDADQGMCWGKENSAQLFREGYENLIKTYLNLKSQPKIILATPLTVSNDPNGGNNGDREKNNTEGTIPIIKELAAKYGLTLVDTHELSAGWSMNDYLEDGLHPNVKGCDKLSGWIKDAVVNEISPEKIRVTCVGDSITDGYLASDGAHTYPAQLQNILGARYVVFNAGVSGRTAIRSLDIAYNTTDRYREGLNSNPDIVIIMIGTNDAVNGIAERQDEFRNDYEQLIKDYQNCGSNPKIILALPTTSVNADRSKDDRCRLNEQYVIPIIKDIAARYNLELLDAHNYTGTWTRENDIFPYLADGLHPNDEGYGRLAKFFANAIIGYVKGYPGDIQENTNYAIISQNSGKAMSISNYSADNEAGLVQMTNNNYQSQVWNLQSTGDGYYKIVNQYSGKSLNVPKASTEQGTQIIQYNAGDSDNEKWILEAVGDGGWRITPKLAANMALNVSGASKDEKGIIIQWPYEGALNEQWRLGKVDQMVENPETNASAAAARAAYDAYVKKFMKEDGQITNIWGFWAKAEIGEVFADAYERFGDEESKNNLIKVVDWWIRTEYNDNYDRDDWSWNDYNDDIMWAVILNTRTYLFTGDQKYLNLAKKNFDMCYARAWTPELNGGLVWKEGNKTKNACVNGPGAIAACYLAKATGDNSYYEKAKGIVEWMDNVLVQDDGSVWDCINWEDNSYNKWVSTYNQGTYIGANTFLYEYYKDQKYLNNAKKAAERATQLGDILNGEDGNGDLIGFKGVLGRWLSRYALMNNDTAFNTWMQNNADAAWSNRNSEDLMWTEFGKQTMEHVEESEAAVDGGSIGNGNNNKMKDYASWGCSAPLSWIINCADIAKRQENGGKDVIPNDPAEPIDDIPTVENVSTIYIEGETAKYENGASLKASDGSSNGYCIENVGVNGGNVTFTVTSEVDGKHAMNIYYVSDQDRYLGVTVNGNDTQNVLCVSGGSWDVTAPEPVSVNVTIKKGENTIEFSGVDGNPAPNIDYFTIDLTDEEIKNVIADLVTSIPNELNGSDADKALVSGVRMTYDKLTDEQKEFVDGELVSKLEIAEKTLADLQNSDNNDGQPTGNNDEQPVNNQDNEPAGNNDGQPVNNQDNEPTGNNNGQPVNNQDNEPAGNNNGQPVNNQDNEPAGNNNGQPVSNQDNEPVSNQDNEPVSNNNGQPVNNQDNEPVSNNNGQPVSNQDNESVSNNNGQPVSNQDNEPVSNNNGQTAGNQNNEPAGNNNGQPVSNQNNEPAGNNNGQPTGNYDGQPTGNQDNEPAGNSNGQLIGNQDNQPIGNNNGQSVSNQDNQPAGNNDGQPVSNQDNQPTGNNDGQPVSNQDNQPTGNNNGQSVSNQDNQPTGNNNGQPIGNQDNQPTNNNGQPVSGNDGQLTGNNNGQLTENNDNQSVVYPKEDNEIVLNEQFKKGKLIYKVTKSSADKVEVQVLKPIKNGNKSISIPNTVSYKGTTCRVTSIAKNAFKGNKKLTNVTIGKNITTIGSKAFYNCNKLKKVTFKKSPLKKVGSGAFLKTAKNLKIKTGDKTNLKKYSNLLKKKIPTGASIVK